MGMKWKVPITMRLPQMAEDFANQVLLSGRIVAIKQAEEIEQWMKDNAPWTDRTGRARAGLMAYLDEEIGSIGVIRLTYSDDIEYGVWLEFAYQGRWGIIAPALDYWGPRVQRSLQNLANLGRITLE